MARSREIPEKCQRCAPLSPAEARAKHPTCWDDKLCTARRFYINNRDRINQKRARKRIERQHQILVPQVNCGVLQVWRELREDSPIQAIGVEVWDGHTALPAAMRYSLSPESYSASRLRIKKCTS